MGGSFGPVLADIILTECEHVTINPVINCGIIKFYHRHGDDTLLLIRHDDINYLLGTMTSTTFLVNFISLTIIHDSRTTSFRAPHFLHLNFVGNVFFIYRKPFFSGQYTHFDSFVPCKNCTAWLRSSLSRVCRICSPSKLKQDLQFVKRIV